MSSSSASRCSHPAAGSAIADQARGRAPQGGHRVSQAGQPRQASGAGLAGGRPDDKIMATVYFRGALLERAARDGLDPIRPPVALVKTMRGQARITESNVQDMLREVRMALLEADVALPVVRDFIARVKDKALGQEVVGSLNPGQALVGIVHKELAATMGAGVPTSTWPRSRRP
jgi:hypothetical protein